MNLLIGIATYKRPEKLKRLLLSLRNSTFKNYHIYIVSDNNDWEPCRYIVHLEDYKNGKITFTTQEKHGFVIGAWNLAIKNNIEKDWDGFIGLCDDVELEPNALENIIKYHKNHFPNTDGVCGFHQVCEGYDNYTYKVFGQTLIGRKFIERYKEVDYNFCAPMYKHFCQDRELYDFALSLNKFKLCQTAILNHDHPCFTRNIDETHNIIRKGKNSPKEHDFKLEKERLKKGLVWGLSWEK